MTTIILPHEYEVGWVREMVLYSRAYFSSETVDGDVDMTTMTGPGGTTYEVFAEGPNGRAGIADLGEGQSRVRVEPSSQDAADAMAEALADWKQPDENNLRFSTEVSDLGKVAAQDLARTSVGAAEQ